MRRLAVALAGAGLVALSGLPGPILRKPLVAEGSDDPATPIYLPYVHATTVDGAELVYVPAGDFLMGAADDDPQAYYDERPQHVVYLDAYWIDKTEVTNEQFGRFVDATGYEAGPWWRDEAAGKANHPVVYVTWFDAKAYCEWAGRQLPTEAQWEKAARGTDGRMYPWGNEAPDASRCNFDLGVGGTTPVGSYPAGASPYGALDVAGNVWEWVVDWYDEGYYANSPSRNPTGPDSGEYRVLRGGSWYSYSRSVRSSSRTGCFPDLRDGRGGFRCARP